MKNKNSSKTSVLNLAAMAGLACYMLTPISFNSHASQVPPDEPKCTNCHSLPDYFECTHSRYALDGDPCSTTECIENDVMTETCDYYADRTGDSDCEATFVAADEGIIQRRRTAACPGGNVEWEPDVTLYWGCPECLPAGFIRKACVIGSCSGPLVSEDIRGTMIACGCL